MNDIIAKTINNNVQEYKEIFYKENLYIYFVVILMNNKLNPYHRRGYLGKDILTDSVLDENIYCVSFPEFNNIRNLGRVCFGDEFIKYCDIILNAFAEEKETRRNNDGETLFYYGKYRRNITNFHENCRLFMDILFEYLHLDLIAILKELFNIKTVFETFEEDKDSQYPFTYTQNDKQLYTDAFCLFNDTSSTFRGIKYEKLNISSETDANYMILGGDSRSIHYEKIVRLLTQIDEDERIKYFAETIIKHEKIKVTELLERKELEEKSTHHLELINEIKLNMEDYSTEGRLYGYEKEKFVIIKDRSQNKVNQLYAS